MIWGDRTDFGRVHSLLVHDAVFIWYLLQMFLRKLLPSFFQSSWEEEASCKNCLHYIAKTGLGHGLGTVRAGSMFCWLGSIVCNACLFWDLSFHGLPEVWTFRNLILPPCSGCHSTLKCCQTVPPKLRLFTTLHGITSLEMECSESSDSHKSVAFKPGCCAVGHPATPFGIAFKCVFCSYPAWLQILWVSSVFYEWLRD